MATTVLPRLAEVRHEHLLEIIETYIFWLPAHHLQDFSIKPPTPHTHAADQAAGRRFGMEPIRKSEREWGSAGLG